MAPLIAHGSGIDEILLFLAAPLLFLLYQAVKRLRGERSDAANEDDPEHRDAPKGA